jgi:hypothetical protein
MFYITIEKRSSPNCKLVGEEFAAIFNDFVKSKVAVESLIVSNINPVIVGVCISNFLGSIVSPTLPVMAVDV